MVVSSYPLYSGVIGSGQRWSSSLSRPPTKKEHKDRQACVYVCMREKNPCEPVRTGAHQIPDARDVTMTCFNTFECHLKPPSIIIYIQLWSYVHVV